MSLRAPLPTGAVAYANAIVVGDVTTVRDADPVQTVFGVTIIRSPKGSETASIEVDTGTTCRLSARVGQHHLLFPRRDGAERLFTTHCMGDRLDPTVGDVDQIARLTAHLERRPSPT